MPVRRAIANGNWSSTSTWFGGVLPGNGDTVAAGGFNIVCDVDILIGGANNPSVNAGSFVSGQFYRVTEVGTTNFTSIGASANAVGIVFQATNVGSGTGVATALATITTAAIAAASAAAGGGFTITTARAFSADVRAGTTPCLTVTGTTDVTWTGTNFVGGSIVGAPAVLNNATSGTIYISSATIAGFSTSQTIAFNNASSGTVSFSSCSITGSNCLYNTSSGTINVDGSTFTNNLGNSALCVNSGTGVFSVTGSTVTGGNGTSATTINNNTPNGTLLISGSILTGGTAAGGTAVNNVSTGTCSITSSTFNASAFAAAFTGANLTANVTIQGSQYDHPNGMVAVYCAKYRIGTTPSLMQYRKALNGTSTFLTLFTPDFGVFGNPAATDVRSGVSYADGGLTGTCAVPPAGSVALGVPVDNTTGSAVLTAAAVQDALSTYGASTLTKADVTNAVIPLV
jgi:hypothetical protein